MTDTGGNRTDLVMSPDKSPGAPSASTHGQAAAKERQRAALPMARPPVLGPSRRPSEPVTAGLPIGPGPGKRPLPRRTDTTLARLRALAADSGDERLAILVGRLGGG